MKKVVLHNCFLFEFTLQIIHGSAGEKVESEPLKIVPACRIIRVMAMLHYLDNKNAELAVL